VPLAEHFIASFNASLNRTAAGLSADAREALLGASWPGNVRELRNVMERAVLLTRRGEAIGRAHLPESMSGADPDAGAPSGAPRSLREQLEEVERTLIRQTLARHGGVMRRAAAELGADPVTLGRRARKYGLV
jgi:transcriptional regulator with PAS, ATPase and Fis domain